MKLCLARMHHCVNQLTFRSRERTTPRSLCRRTPAAGSEAPAHEGRQHHKLTMYHAAHQQLARGPARETAAGPDESRAAQRSRRSPRSASTSPPASGRGRELAWRRREQGSGSAPGRWVNRRWSYRLETAPLYRKRHFSLKRRSLSVVVGELLEARRAAVEHAEQRKCWQQNFETRPDSFYSGSTQRYRYCARELRCAAGSLASGLSLLAHRSRLLHSSRRLATAFARTSSRSPCAAAARAPTAGPLSTSPTAVASRCATARSSTRATRLSARGRASVARRGRPASPVPSSSRCCPARLRPALGLIWEPDAAVAAHYLCEHARREQIRECHPLQRVQQREQREQRGKELEATRRTAARAGDE